jgi:hypothetical protein
MQTKRRIKVLTEVLAAWRQQCNVSAAGAAFEKKRNTNAANALLQRWRAATTKAAKRRLEGELQRREDIRLVVQSEFNRTRFILIIYLHLLSNTHSLCICILYMPFQGVSLHGGDDE